ncbi:MAG: succinate dehydrogenase, hydrophobic membrane anchor protein [Gammaproteobacteria bacterium]|nr:succinate dehydrogenase, hydrophobic membrane anchor protein [Gammaproteobacteria bacterium]
MSLRTPLGQVLGTGSARQGVHHWWVQRLTSVALVPLSIWFLVSLLTLSSLDHATVSAWMTHGSTALLLILLVLAATRHSQLGVAVVLEDYVHGGLRTLSLVISSFAHVLLAAAGVLAILRTALRGMV